MKFRPAIKKDYQTIITILKDVDEDYKDQTLDNFYVAEEKGQIAGVVKLKNYDNFFFLSSLAVSQNHQKRGIASFILKELIKKSDKSIYLYTIIPEFFKKFGFKITKQKSFLPSKNSLECENCFPGKCVCMVKEGTVA
ncbi:hypothetical protein A2230_05745 [candidate division WOR-1 bacterium RIFOXYA2_FULL_36_21]|uniref:N-acetyltransferase domain-containing protein n=1 Tax=candidate division WOR-1 bacterium RIFOXYB2_FULL_36_35 TaxID=1802578 RepID=A0A1F4S8X6_UNCSA|nr:MAG: hypothetical protein A2230_05745 [candidate division WOR-1 bacterium RIFOXYA2_FULL_36_21]OGC16859.1 MAG: hypothetical protein A2290_05030 [candidate division WOR-1 bacterium RIFOXYB2_FULL_36_35]OGC18674.1 MAG: hypothetical protein A2282_07180 [candidate division WOR-1 bacterium RIFOXYA12_FULL_36_13]